MWKITISECSLVRLMCDISDFRLPCNACAVNEYKDMSSSRYFSTHHVYVSIHPENKPFLCSFSSVCVFCFVLFCFCLSDSKESGCSSDGGGSGPETDGPGGYKPWVVGSGSLIYSAAHLNRSTTFNGISWKSSGVCLVCPFKKGEKSQSTSCEVSVY